MKIFLLIIISFILFWGCDDSFNFTNPSSYNSESSKINVFCKSDTDCNENLICNKVNSKCIVNPCIENNIDCSGKGSCEVNRETMQFSCNCDDNYHYDGIKSCVSLCYGHEDCGGKGICISESIESFKCECENGYNNINNSYICEIAESPCVGIDCGDGGVCKITEDNKAYCDCMDGYQNIVNPLICFLECTANDCLENGNCKYYLNNIDNELLIGRKYCDCDDNYYQKEENGIISCETPCESSDCIDQNGDLKGSCVAENLTDKKCECIEGYQDSDNNLTCEISCDNENYGCDINGICHYSNGFAECRCNEGFQLTDNGQGCYWSGYMWNKLFDYDITVNDIKTDSENNLYIAGYFKGEVDFNPSSGTDIKHSNGEYEDMFITRINASGTYGWTKTFGSINTDKINSIDIDSEDNIYLAGVFCSNTGGTTYTHCSISFNERIESNGGSDAFIIKMNKLGNIIFNFRVGGTDDDEYQKISVENNKFFVSGRFTDMVNFNPEGSNILYSSLSNDYFISLFNSNGSYISTNKISATNANLSNIKAFTDNGITSLLLSVYFKNTIYLYNTDSSFSDYTSSGEYDSILVKLNENGDFEWNKIISGIDSEEIIDFDIDNLGNIYILGNFCGDEINNCDVDFDPSENTDILQNQNNTDMFISKYNKYGVYLWTKLIKGQAKNFSHKIRVAKAHNYFYITGGFDKQILLNNIEIGSTEIDSIFLAKFDINGNFITSKSIENRENDESDIAIDMMNNTYISFKAYEDSDINPTEEDFIINDDSSVIIKLQEEEPNCENNNNCGGHGECVTDNINSSPYCVCDDYYQDNDMDLYCEPGCSEEIICSNHGVCDDNGDEVTCLCDGGYDVVNNVNCDIIKYQWSRVIKKSSSQNYIYPSSIIKNNDFIYIAGDFKVENDNYKIDFDFTDTIDKKTSNLNSSDIFLIKADIDGNYLYSKTFGGTGDDVLDAFTIYNNSYYMGGRFRDSMDFNFLNGEDIKSSSNGSSFLTKLENENEYAWTLQLDSGYIESISVSTDAIYVTGSFSNSIDLDPSELGEDIFTANNLWESSVFWAKYDQNGNYISGNAFNGGELFYGEQIINDGENIYISGVFIGENASFGNTDEYSSIQEDTFVLKIDSNNNIVYNKIFSGNGNEAIKSLYYKDNYIYITGIFDDNFSFTDIENRYFNYISENGDDIFILKMDTDGNVLWGNVIAGNNNDIPNSIKVDDSNIFITGSFKENINIEFSNRSESYNSYGEGDVFTLKMDLSGGITDFYQLGGTENDYGISMISDENNLYITGKSGSQLDYDISEYTEDIKGGSGLFILKNLK